MILDYLCTASVVLAAVLQFAVHRGPDMQDREHSHRARKVLIAGLMLLAVHMLQQCIEGIAGNPVAVLGLLLVSLAEVTFCVSRLFPEIWESVVAHLPIELETERG
jgi:hypothetical protein